MTMTQVMRFIGKAFMQYHKRLHDYVTVGNTVVNNREIKMAHKGKKGKGEESLQINSIELVKCAFIFINLSSVFETITL